MMFNRRTAMMGVIATVLLAPLAGRAEPEPAPSYAVMSLVGDSISTVVFAPTKGTRMDESKKVVTEIKSAIFDNEAIQAANLAIKQHRPGVNTVLMITPDTGLYKAQNAMFDDVAANKDNREYLKSLLKNRAVSKLVLITKYRSDAEFKVEHGYVGNGKLEGLGFYVNNQEELIHLDTLHSALGFVASYAYAKVRLIDAQTLDVLKEVTVKQADFFSNVNVTTGEAFVWNAVSSEDKIKRLQLAVGRAMDEAIPKLLAQ